MNATLEATRADQRTRLTQLTAACKAIGERIVAEGRPLTPGERNKLEALRAAKAELLDTLAQVRAVARQASQASAPPAEALSC